MTLKSSEDIKRIAKIVLKNESDALLKLIDYVDDSFVKSVELIYNSKGRVVITGVGKSAIIAQKIVATMNSTGTPSIYMHAADAIHGDLGNIQTDDVVVCISKSGNTPEVKVLLPLIKNFGNSIIAITGNLSSALAESADYVLNSTIEEEACPNNLAPTTSTTAQLAMGDALAVCLLDLKSFTSNDFAKYHPGGALGKKLYLRVGEVADQNEKPMVKPEDSLNQVILEISSKRLGATAVVSDKQLVGVITDGDLRRMLSTIHSLGETKANDIMSTNPKIIDYNSLAVEALKVMKANHISQLIVINNGEYAGLIHLHDLIREGII
ncbi:KpsF/GutQ family sugar-phosphate isomerase [Vicingaceae bacterium]|nr:KpsF/GutQ family sugar-phosphate isomerase [Vicingaceae bacterium]